MHQTHPDGTLIASFCDFCRAPFADAPMIEGHQGSLICLKCLTVAYSELVIHKRGGENSGSKCRMCLEERKDPLWESPLEAGALVCNRCVKQAATALDKDPESGWTRPKHDGAPSGTTNDKQ